MAEVVLAQLNPSMLAVAPDTSVAAQVALSQLNPSTLAMVPGAAVVALQLGPALRGPAGPAGPAGGPGAGGGDANLAWPQLTPLATWLIAHGLGKYPSVTVIDSAGDQVMGRIEYVDANTVRLVFSAAFSGTAYLN
jgi:hypothetical protein